MISAELASDRVIRMCLAVFLERDIWDVREPQATGDGRVVTE
jgi:hypothetical protein